MALTCMSRARRLYKSTDSIFTSRLGMVSPKTKRRSEKCGLLARQRTFQSLSSISGVWKELQEGVDIIYEKREAGGPHHIFDIKAATIDALIQQITSPKSKSKPFAKDCILTLPSYFLHHQLHSLTRSPTHTHSIHYPHNFCSMRNNLTKMNIL